MSQIEERDAEIERLRVELFDAGEKRIWLTNQIEAQRKLIGELAEALRSRIPWAWREKDQPHMELIGRARTSVEPEVVGGGHDSP